MGYTEAARAASPRGAGGLGADDLRDACRLAAAHRAIDARPARGGRRSCRRYRRHSCTAAIECGAMVDPWNILGFGGQYSLFPAAGEQRPRPSRRRTARHDRRHLRALRAAAQSGRRAGRATAVRRRRRTDCRSWPTGGTSSPRSRSSSVEGCSGRDTFESAEHVGEALRAWHEAGAAAGDLAFWRGRVEHFRSPKAYALVIDTLLDHRDPVAAMALLGAMAQPGRRNPAGRGDYSFHDSAWSGWKTSGAATRHHPSPGQRTKVGSGAEPGLSAKGQRAGSQRAATPPFHAPAELAARAEVPRLPRSQRRAVLAGAELGI